MRALLLAILGLVLLTAVAGAQAEWEWIGPSSTRTDVLAVDAEGAIFIGGDFSNMQVTEDEGLTWTELSGPFRLASAVAAPAGTLVCSDSRADGLWVTADKGVTWSRVSVHQPEEWVAVLALHPQTADIFATVQFVNLFYSQDGGYSWQPVAAPLNCIDYWDLAFAENGSIWVKGDASLWRSDDYGASWTDLAMPSECAYGGGLFVAPGPVLFLWGQDRVAYRFSLLRSTDLGVTWEPLSDGLPAPPYRQFTAMEDGDDGTLLLADILNGVFRSTDQGGSWEPYSQGLDGPETNITCLADRPGGGYYAASLYDGVFRRPHDVEAVPVSSEVPGLTSLKVSPNPIREETAVAFTLAAEGPARISLYDARGRCLHTLAAGDFGSGEHRLRLDVRDLAGGVYFCRLEGVGARLSRRLIMVR